MAYAIQRRPRVRLRTTGLRAAALVHECSVRDELLDDEDEEVQQRAKRGGDDDGDDPRDTPPPVIYGEEIESPCDPQYVDGIPSANDCDPKRHAVSSTCAGTVTGFIFPGSRWENRRGIRSAITEINRSFEFFAKYCIFLKLDQMTLSRRDLRMLRAWYRQWYRTKLLPAVGGASHLGTMSINTDVINEYRGAMWDLQKRATDGGVKLLVIFCDEYINDYRPSLGSSNRRDSHQIGIIWIDRNSPYILAHELVHAFGKSAPGTPGALTWDHKSACPRAITTIARSRQPIDLSNRFLDIKEDVEIRVNRGGNVLGCSAGGCPAN